ncbi:MAG TPA: hypothetical protein VGE04_16700 [Chloroflexia bacterium]|jgi:hypothetical protein
MAKRIISTTIAKPTDGKQAGKKPEQQPSTQQPQSGQKPKQQQDQGQGQGQAPNKVEPK